jgi:hypothetical protein
MEVYPLVIMQKASESYWKLPFLADLHINSMVIFHSFFCMFTWLIISQHHLWANHGKPICLVFRCTCSCEVPKASDLSFCSGSEFSWELFVFSVCMYMSLWHSILCLFSQFFIYCNYLPFGSIWRWSMPTYAKYFW